MASTAVAERPEAQLPVLAPTPALSIGADDIALPKLYTGQFMSKAVMAQNAKMGDIYAAANADDEDPQILWSIGDDKDKGVLIHVIGLRKAKSFSDGGDLQIFDFDDPNAPADAWVTYNYTLAVPEIDTDVPFKLTLTRTGRPTAQKINTVLAKGSVQGPSYIHAFRLTTAERKNQKGTYAVTQAATVEATSENIAVAEKLFLMIGTSNAGSPSSAVTGNEPAI